MQYVHGAKFLPIQATILVIVVQVKQVKVAMKPEWDLHVVKMARSKEIVIEINRAVDVTSTARF